LLLMHGDRDALGVIKKIAPGRAGLEPICQYVVIPDARHFVILDNALFFAQTLMAFLEKWAP
jgi:pimeloyl-ACP methyl ester carboxylesterase